MRNHAIIKIIINSCLKLKDESFDFHTSKIISKNYYQWRCFSLNFKSVSNLQRDLEQSPSSLRG